MASVALQCRSRTDQDGLARVRLRIEHKGEQKFVSTDLKVKPEKWRGDNVTRSHREADTINSALRRIESNAQDALTALRASPRRITARRLKKEVQEALGPDDDPVGQVGFADFCEERIEAEYDNASTRRSHSTAVTKLRYFLQDTRGVEDVPLSPEYVTPALFEEMQRWESEVRENSVNTIHKTMRTLRRMVNIAIRDDLFPRSEYPFDQVSLTRERTGKTPLNAKQITALEHLRTEIEDGDTRFLDGGLPSHALRAWLFGLYMLGMRWSDVSSLEWEQIRDGRLKYKMRKTGEQKDLSVVPKARDILDYYEKTRPDRRFVFPFLDRYGADHDLTTDAGVGAASRKALRRVNQELKAIAKAAGIDVTLTTHIARHSAAQRMLDAGWSLQDINAALGHKDLSTTEHYLRSIQDEELDDQHEDLF